MSANRQKTEYRVGTGAASLLMVFVVLCLAALAILAFSTARADMSMTRRNVMMIDEYYRAANLAQRAIAEIDAQIAQLQARAQGDEAAVERGLPEITVEGIAIEVDQLALSFRVDVGHDRVIDVKLIVNPLGSEARYEIVRHKMVVLDDNWVPDFGGQLHQGNGGESAQDIDAMPDDAGVDVEDNLEMLD